MQAGRQVGRQATDRRVRLTIGREGGVVFQGGDDGRGYRNMCKIPGGSKSILGH